MRNPSSSKIAGKVRARILFTLWLSLVAYFGSTEYAHAYIDPATTSYIIQIVSGLIISLSVVFGVFFRRIQMFVVTLRARLLALLILLTSPKHRKRKQKSNADKSDEPSCKIVQQASEDTTLAIPTELTLGAASTTTLDAASTTTLDATSITTLDAASACNLVIHWGDNIPGRTKGKLTGEAKSERNAKSKGSTDRFNGRGNQTRREFLFSDCRSLRKRLGIAALLAAAIAFTFIFFGICDLFIVNRSTMPYYLTDVIAYIGIEAFIVFLALTLLMILTKGRMFDYVVSFFLGMLLMLYVNGNFMNMNLGQLTGDSIPWDWYLDYALINTLICGLILLIPFILRFISAKAWTVVTMFVPGLLIVMQLISLLNSFAMTGVLNTPGQSETYLSDEGLYQVSAKHNIVVFILDRLDDSYIDAILADQPDFFDGELLGFTRYTNNISTHSRTFPSVINILTGIDTKFDRPAAVYSRDAYQNGSFLTKLHEQGYINYVYTERNSGYFDGSDLDGKADNVETGRLVVDAPPALQKLSILSLYRYVPHALKPSFWLSTNQFYGDASYSGENSLYMIDDAAFMNKLKRNRLQVIETENAGIFHFIHLNGPHTPYTLNEDGSQGNTDTSGLTAQTKGSFRIVFEYLEQLKQNGLYDNATVIITGDHGYPAEGYTSDWHPLESATLTGLFYKPSGSTMTALKRNDNPTNANSLRSTVLSQAGVSKTILNADASLSAPIYNECNPENVAERTFYFRIGESGVASYSLEEISVSANAKSFSNWRRVRFWPIQYWQY